MPYELTNDEIEALISKECPKCKSTLGRENDCLVCYKCNIGFNIENFAMCKTAYIDKINEQTKLKYLRKP